MKIVETINEMKTMNMFNKNTNNFVIIEMG